MKSDQRQTPNGDTIGGSVQNIVNPTVLLPALAAGNSADGLVIDSRVGGQISKKKLSGARAWARRQRSGRTVSGRCLCFRSNRWPRS